MLNNFLLRYLYYWLAQNSNSGDLWGHGNLQTASEASEVASDLKFDISNLNYPGIHVHITYNSHFGGLWGHSGLNMTSEVTSDLKFELSDLNYPCSSAFLAPKCFFELIAPERPIIIPRAAYSYLVAAKNNITGMG